MRIQHNIAALNSYRNLTNNNSAVSKNLEKLSSGYRINRAGDDAAGLAISEKMRAQITGLNTAQKNANDGISLVQTAEGALTEVHSMLNRMVELANQSANGTYADDVDRENLQAEVNSLTDEIDRISKSTNFNGLNLLNGKMASTTTPADDIATGFKDMSASITHEADARVGTKPVKGVFSLDLTSLEMRNDGIKADIKGATTAAITGAEGTAADKASVSFDVAGMEVKMPADATTGSVKINVGGVEFEIDMTADTGDGAGGGADGIISDEEIAQALVNKTITVKDDAGNDVTLTASVTNNTEVKFEAANAGVTVGVADAFDGKDITVKDNGNDAAATVGITFGSGDKLGAITIEKGKSMTGAEWAEKFMASIAGNDNKVTIDNMDYVVSNKDGKLTFTMADDPTEEFDTDLKVSLALTDSTGNETYAAAGAAAESIDTTPAKDNDKGAFINQGHGIGVHIDTQAVAGVDQVLAQGVLDLTALGIKDGTALKIGNDTYIFAVGAESKVKDMANVVDLTKYETLTTDAYKDASRQLSKLAAGNKMFDISTDNTNQTVRLTERKNSGIDYTKNNLQGTSAADLKDATNAAWKDLIQVGTANPDAKAASTTGGLTLQIGDTSDDFNRLTVSIGDMSSKALGISKDDINIGTQEGAAKAVDKIKAAINKVSSQRGDLGAIQNRLEHTINNLSVTAENITAAESRIRDVDMANEMMAYTKNNILVQAAQAMLAQANQVPQGVLQLLQ